MVRHYAIAGAFLVALAVGCAQVGTPTGGPPDETPPRVVETSPADSAVEVPSRARVTIRFSERMDRGAVERALFISPYPDPFPSLRWSHGDRLLTLHFGEPLAQGHTYVITIGTEARDAHGNRLADAYTFAFATGPRINSGQIRGSVWQEQRGILAPAVGTLVGLYPLAGNDGDPDPTEMYATYETQAGADGSFTFSYLAPGRYRVFAWNDRDGDELVGEDEAVAIPARDISLAEGEDVHLPPMRLTVFDRRPPELLLVRAEDREHIELRFDEPVAAESVRVRVVAPETLAARVIPTPQPARTVRIRTAPQTPEESYGIALAVSDPFGNAVSWGPDTTRFDARALPDTNGPKLIAYEPSRPLMMDSLSALVLWFDDVLGEVIFDSLGAWEDSLLVPGYWSSGEINRLVFHPIRSIAPGRTVWRIPLGAVSDASGNWGKDTAVVALARILPDSLGALEGTVEDADTTASGAIIVQARPLHGEWASHTALPGPGVWRMEGLPAGAYRLFAWRDADGDGRWSPGSARPFVSSERWVQSDTVTVRARWTSAGVTLTLE